MSQAKNFKITILRPLLLILLCLLGVFPLDVILPSFPALSEAFQVEPKQIAYSVSLFAFGVAVAQIFIGPLSDRTGRKRLLIVGLGVSIAGAIGCLISTDYEIFWHFGCCKPPAVAAWFLAKHLYRTCIVESSATPCASC